MLQKFAVNFNIQKRCAFTLLEITEAFPAKDKFSFFLGADFLLESNLQYIRDKPICF